MEKTTSEFERTATRVSAVSITVNLLLAAFKLLAGILGHSSAMISDAVHSSSDVCGSIIVIVGVRLSEKASDQDHPYGHERMESVAQIILSVILMFAGVLIGVSAVTSIARGSYLTSPMPGMLALVAAIVSIVSKEAMFWYTWLNAKKIHSGALRAEAWHHRSDAMSSIGSLIGIAGARMGVRVLDPVASLVICALIIKVAIDIFREAVDQMVDHAASPETEKEIREYVQQCPGVEGIDLLNTRVFGRKVYVDLEIAVDGNESLRDAHAVAQRVHDGIEKTFPDVKHIMIHVNPAEEQKTSQKTYGKP